MLEHPYAQQFFLRAAPVLIALLACCVLVVVFFLAGEKANAYIQPYALNAKDKLERSGMTVKTETLVFFIIFGSFFLWATIVIVFKPQPIFDLMLAPLSLLLIIGAVDKWIQMKIVRRRSAFVNQLELVLRLMSSGVRAGLGIRQALVIVTDELSDPAKYEFNLVLMQTNIGVGVNDALSRLALRMPNQEVEMMTRAIRMQSTTGGNLGKTLDVLATTIKERRKLFRKVKALTVESRGSAWVLGLIPILLFCFIVLSDSQFRSAVFQSRVGWIGMGIAAALEGIGGFILYKLTLFKI